MLKIRQSLGLINFTFKLLPISPIFFIISFQIKCILKFIFFLIKRFYFYCVNSIEFFFFNFTFNIFHVDFNVQ